MPIGGEGRPLLKDLKAIHLELLVCIGSFWGLGNEEHMRLLDGVQAFISPVSGQMLIELLPFDQRHSGWVPVETCEAEGNAECS